jgi:hypothetical protein
MKINNTLWRANALFTRVKQTSLSNEFSPIFFNSLAFTSNMVKTVMNSTRGPKTLVVKIFTCISFIKCRQTGFVPFSLIMPEVFYFNCLHDMTRPRLQSFFYAPATQNFVERFVWRAGMVQSFCASCWRGTHIIKHRMKR